MILFSPFDGSPSSITDLQKDPSMAILTMTMKRKSRKMESVSRRCSPLVITLSSIVGIGTASKDLQLDCSCCWRERGKIAFQCFQSHPVQHWKRVFQMCWNVILWVLWIFLVLVGTNSNPSWSLLNAATTRGMEKLGRLLPKCLTFNPGGGMLLVEPWW